MNSHILVLCDTEEEYAQHMSEFLKGHKEVPWMIYTYSDVDELLDFAGREQIEVLVVAEKAYTREVNELSVGRKILLNESGLMKWESVINVDKYQKAETVYKEILNACMDVTDLQFPRLKVLSDVHFIGMYSPVRRCLQTPFALTLGQILAAKHRTLYLNFEHYAGISELMPDIQSRDLADLLYFLTAQQDKFRLWMQSILMKKGEMDYIPPMKAGQNLLGIQAEEWQQLLQNIAQTGEYEYVILDLSESMQGLFDILRICDKVFTLTKEDAAARSKILQYEQVLALYEREDILEKTCKYKLPLFQKLPDQIEYYTKGDLADYVSKVIREELE